MLGWDRYCYLVNLFTGCEVPVDNKNFADGAPGDFMGFDRHVCPFRREVVVVCYSASSQHPIYC